MDDSYASSSTYFNLDFFYLSLNMLLHDVAIIIIMYVPNPLLYLLNSDAIDLVIKKNN